MRMVFRNAAGRDDHSQRKYPGKNIRRILSSINFMLETRRAQRLAKGDGLSLTIGVRILNALLIENALACHIDRSP